MSGANDVSECSLREQWGREQGGELSLGSAAVVRAAFLTSQEGWVYSRISVGFPQSIIATFTEAFNVGRYS